MRLKAKQQTILLLYLHFIFVPFSLEKLSSCNFLLSSTRAQISQFAFFFGGMSDDLIRLGIASLSRYVIIRDKAFVDDDTEKAVPRPTWKKTLLTVPAPLSARISRRILLLHPYQAASRLPHPWPCWIVAEWLKFCVKWLKLYFNTPQPRTILYYLLFRSSWKVIQRKLIFSCSWIS